MNEHGRCACLCRLNHPQHTGICTEEAHVTVTTSGGSQIPMCAACAEAWDEREDAAT